MADTFTSSSEAKTNRLFKCCIDDPDICAMCYIECERRPKNDYVKR